MTTTSLRFNNGCHGNVHLIKIEAPNRPTEIEFNELINICQPGKKHFLCLSNLMYPFSHRSKTNMSTNHDKWYFVIFLV